MIDRIDIHGIDCCPHYDCPAPAVCICECPDCYAAFQRAGEPACTAKAVHEWLHGFRPPVDVSTVMSELDEATKRHPPFHSAHEGFAVLLEEVDELKAEVWKRPTARDRAAMRREAVQVAAMALRFLRDCT